jgi:hypothetical protein
VSRLECMVLVEFSILMNPTMCAVGLLAATSYISYIQTPYSSMLSENIVADSSTSRLQS